VKKAVSIIFLILNVLAALPAASASDKISVAVEENFFSAFTEIAANFEEQTGVKVEATFSSTGDLYRRIKNGVPYDVFLAVDERWPDLLQQEGWTDGTFIYARGPTILWSADGEFCKAPTWQDALKSDRIRKVSMVHPVADAYGAAAKTALQKAGLWEALQGKLVNGPDSVKVFRHVVMQAADAGFCAHAAQTGRQGEEGCFFSISEAPDVLQTGCILRKAVNPRCAELFMAYLLGADAAKTKKKYGFR